MIEYTDGSLVADSQRKGGGEYVLGIGGLGSLCLLDVLYELDAGARTILEAVEKNHGKTSNFQTFFVRSIFSGC